MNDYWLVVTLANSWPKTEVEEKPNTGTVARPRCYSKRRSTPSTWSTRNIGRASVGEILPEGRPAALSQRHDVAFFFLKKNQKNEKIKIIICTERTMFSRCSKASILMPSLSLFKNGLFYSFRSCNLNREVVGLRKNPSGCSTSQPEKSCNRIGWRSHSSIVVYPIWIMNPIMIGFRIWILIRSCRRIFPQNPQSNWSCDSETWRILQFRSVVNRRCGNIVIGGN